MEVLVEIHSHYRTQMEIAKQVAWVYDFALPPLVLHAFAFRTAKRLKEWLRIRPANARDRARHARRHRHRRRRRPAGAGAPGLRAARGARTARGNDSREQPWREPARDGRRRVEPRPLSGELHVLRRVGARRSKLFAGARHPVLCSGHSAGLLRRSPGRPERSRSLVANRRGPRHQSALLPIATKSSKPSSVRSCKSFAS